MNRPNNTAVRTKMVVLYPAAKSITETFHFMPDAVDEGFWKSFGDFLGCFALLFFTAEVLHGRRFVLSNQVGVGSWLSPAKGEYQSGSSR